MTRTPLRLTIACGVAALLFLGMGAGIRAGLAKAPAPTIECDPLEATYGDTISCVATGADVTAILWPDGAVAALDSARALHAVGDHEISAIDEAGTVLASTASTITPDIAIECDEGEEKIIFELAATDLRDRGWDYVFVDQVTGDRVHPGDPRHPNGGDEAGLDRVEVGRDISTGICKIVSTAAEEVDGDYTMSIVSELEGTFSRNSRLIGPSSRTRWAGIQPAELTGTVTVDGVSASERRGVYLSGCN